MVDVSNEPGVRTDELGLVALTRFAPSRLWIHPQADLSIPLMGEATMAEYRQCSMDLSDPTDAMSFPTDELWEPTEDEEPSPGLLGDIVLCPQMAARQATENGRRPAVEAEYFLIYGLFHLLEHGHAEPEEKAIMFGLNDRIITTQEVTHSSRQSNRPVNN